MSFPSTVELSYGMEKQTGTTQNFRLGTRAVTPDGRVFYYALAGEAIGAGQVIMQKAGTAAEDMDLAVASAASVGDTSIELTLTTAITEDQYADGYVYINDAAGEGHMYRLDNGNVSRQAHIGTTSGTDVTFNLHPDEDIREALTTSSLAGLMENPFKDVEIYDADDVDGPPVGVAPTEVANNEYFWAQTQGYCAVLVDVQATLGQHVRVSDNTDGAIEPLDRDGTAEDEPAIGVAALIAAVSTDYQMVLLAIPGLV